MRAWVVKARSLWETTAKRRSRWFRRDSQETREKIERVVSAIFFFNFKYYVTVVFSLNLEGGNNITSI